MPGRLDGVVTLVTGGAQGIGRAVAERALAEGARVGLVDLDSDRGAETARGLGPEVAFERADITVEADVARAVAALAEALGGPVRALVNNAGRNAYGDAQRMGEAEWDEVFAVDLKGAWLCTKHVLPGMLAAGGGAIVNVASIHARLTTAGMFPYAAAKSGLVGLTRSLALDYGARGIRVNALSPGYTRTRLVEEELDRKPPEARERVLAVHPMGRIGEPAEIATVACFLLSAEASFVTGAEWAVDGGLSARFA